MQMNIKERLKKGDKGSAQILAKELIRARKAKENIYKSKAQLNSVTMQLQQNLAQMKIAGTMQKSAQIMQMMNESVKLPQISQVMMTLGREMEKAGMIQEMMTDVLEQVQSSVL